MSDSGSDTVSLEVATELFRLLRGLCGSHQELCRMGLVPYPVMLHKSKACCGNLLSELFPGPISFSKLEPVEGCSAGEDMVHRAPHESFLVLRDGGADFCMLECGPGAVSIELCLHCLKILEKACKDNSMDKGLMEAPVKKTVIPLFSCISLPDTHCSGCRGRQPARASGLCEKESEY